jgi:hypothetical protein
MSSLNLTTSRLGPVVRSIGWVALGIVMAAPPVAAAGPSPSAAASPSPSLVAASSEPAVAWPPCGTTPIGEQLDPEMETGDLGQEYPPPPDTFDPAEIPFVGSLTAYPNDGDPAWVGHIDGSEMRCAAPATGKVVRTLGGRVLYLDWQTGASASPRFAVREVDGAVRRLIHGAADFTLAGGARAAMVIRRDGDPNTGHSTDRGVWRVPLDGSSPHQVIPGRGERENSWLVTSWDGRSVATAIFAASGLDPGPTPPMLVRFDGGPIRRIQPYAVPLGFDARGRLILFRGRVRAYDPRDGSLTPLGPRGRDAVVTPRGRWIIVEPSGDDRPRMQTIRVRDGVRRTWELAPGGWSVVEGLTTDRYIVLQDVASQDTWSRIGIVDLDEGWIGYLRFVPRPSE